MSSKAVDVTAKPTLREQYFTDRSGIALALSVCLSVGPSVGQRLLRVKLPRPGKICWRARNEERACSSIRWGKGRRRRKNRFRAPNLNQETDLSLKQ